MLFRHRMSPPIVSRRNSSPLQPLQLSTISPSPRNMPTECPPGFLPIPSGPVFLDGSRRRDRTLVAEFCIHRTEVTAGQFAHCVDLGLCQPVNSAVCSAPRLSTWDRRKSFPDNPINCVTWNDANDFCASVGGYLPSESEWKRAARDDSFALYPWGNDNDLTGRVNGCGKECAPIQGGIPAYASRDSWPDVSPVGSIPSGASRFGVLDLVGNLWEWTAMLGRANGRCFPYRGGSWIQGGTGVDLQIDAYRCSAVSQRSSAVGFRCAHAVILRSQ